MKLSAMGSPSDGLQRSIENALGLHFPPSRYYYKNAVACCTCARDYPPVLWAWGRHSELLESVGEVALHVHSGLLQRWWGRTKPWQEGIQKCCDTTERFNQRIVPRESGRFPSWGQKRRRRNLIWFRSKGLPNSPLIHHLVAFEILSRQS